MKVKNERIVAYITAIVLFIVGVVCYAAFPNKAPEEPVRIMLKSIAGNILFSHKGHTSEDGYGIACDDCHHLFEDDGAKPSACGECHEVDSDEEDLPKRSDAFHMQCIGCHDDEGSAPTKCAGCHAP